MWVSYPLSWEDILSPLKIFYFYKNMKRLDIYFRRKIFTFTHIVGKIEIHFIEKRTLSIYGYRNMKWLLSRQITNEH